MTWNKWSDTAFTVLFYLAVLWTAQSHNPLPSNPPPNTHRTTSPPPPQYLSAPRKLPGLAGARVLPHPSSLSGRAWLYWGEEKRGEKEKEERIKRKVRIFTTWNSRQKKHKISFYDLYDAPRGVVCTCVCGVVVRNQDGGKVGRGGSAVISPDTNNNNRHHPATSKPPI